MTDDLQARIRVLADAGWTLASQRPGRLEPVPDQPGLFREVEGAFTFEKLWRGSRIREVGDSLERAVGMAEWQENRISQLDQQQQGAKSTALTGLFSTLH